jgi:hypothetical protein
MGEIMFEEIMEAIDLPVALSVSDPGVRKNRMSDAERERRSQQAKRLVAEGKLGGRGGGAPSKLRTKLAVKVGNEIAGMSETRLSLAIAVIALVKTMDEDDAKLILDAVLRRGS